MPPAYAVSPVAQIALRQMQMNAQMQLQAAQQQTQSPSTVADLAALQKAQAEAALNAAKSYLDDEKWHHRQRAKSLRYEGDEIVVRMAFWGEIPLVGPRVCRKLSDRLESLTDSLERVLERC